MEFIDILDEKYKLICNEKDGFVLEEVLKVITDYFLTFDYILGDWAYGKLRLKGFYAHDNALCHRYNDYDMIDNYIKNFCAYGCKYFILAKEKVA